ncbi:hypothetical protein PGB90_006931 [Kerria lacca]
MKGSLLLTFIDISEENIKMLYEFDKSFSTYVSSVKTDSTQNQIASFPNEM